MGEYKSAILRFLNDSRFNDIKKFTAWNEPNSDGQPTSYAKRRAAHQPESQGPTRAAQFWATFAKLCRDTYHCSVAAGEFVDGADYSTSYFTAYKNALTRQPTVWAFHPYIAANSPAANRAERLDRFIQGTRRTDGHASAKIWLTEAGGIVHSKAFPTGTEASAQIGTQRLINDVVNRSSRISRLYYYALLGDPATLAHPNAFDSGLLRYTDGTARPMYADYKSKTNPGP